MSSGQGWEKFKRFWKKFWFIVWKDNSFKGLLISLIFLFLIIRFVFFPVLELSTGTKLPLVIVESCSMYHQGNFLSDFDKWWTKHENKYEQFSITKSIFEKSTLKKGFNKGDILFVAGTNPEKLKIGDIIIFNANYQNPIIHRIVKITKNPDNTYTFSTIGDNNYGQLSIEQSIPQDEIVGKSVFRVVPYLGWIKLVFFEPSKPASERGFCHEN